MRIYPFLIWEVDEIESRMNMMIKGKGGALLREKMVKGACNKFIVIVDGSKLLKHHNTTIYLLRLCLSIGSVP